jgi:CHAD domain-containing protein
VPRCGIVRQVTASHYVLPADLPLTSLGEALASQLELEAEKPEAVERVFYDTFDGLVRSVGLALFGEAGRLVLVDGDGREAAAMDSPRSVAAVRVADLAAGALRDRLAPVIEVRAATRIAKVRSRRQAWRVLDAERKTVARLVLEEPSIMIGPRERAPLAARLSIIGIRGYEKALNRIQRVVERELALSAASESLVDEAVARSGGTPGGVSSKLDVALKPRQRADSAAVVILTQLTAAIEANLPGTLADIDSEFLHDLRVAVRRTRSLQRELKDVFPPDELARFRAEFRWLQEITGPSRDLDVYLLEFDDFVATLPEAQRGDLQPLRAVLTDHRRRERQRMVRRLRSPRTRALLGEWKQLIEQLPGLPQDDRPDAARPVADVAARRIAEVYRQMVKMGGKIDEQSPPVALHDLRKKGKELRYLLEFFARLFPSDTVGPMVKTLKSLQDTLGRFQDREVQAEMLRSLGAEMSEQEHGVAALMAMGVLVERLETQQAQARAEFAQRFAPFAAKPRRDAVKETFG